MKLNLNSFCAVAAFLILSSAVFAEVRLVPSVYPTIQEGIDAADNGDTIVVGDGTYYEDVNSRGKSITLRSVNPYDPNVVAATVIDANGSGTVVTFPNNVSAVCVLAGFTITNGNSSNGGGIRCFNGAITINDCIITGNSATGAGGGIASRYADLTLTGCTFSQNTAHESGPLSGGGGIFTQWGELTLTDCQFSENEAVNHSGGGIRSLNGALTLTNCTFSSNSAAVEGGGVATDSNSVILTNCTFTGNSAQLRGGGMNNSHWGATATNCVFISNSAPKGGGICTKDLNEGDETLRLTNCTFSQNIADLYGGAVNNRQDGNLILTNCVLWGNIAYEEGPQIAMEDNGTVSVSYSCLQGGEGDVYTDGGADLEWGDGSIDDDPCFADTSGGDCHLLSTAGRWDANTSIWVTDDSNSPCIDTGDPNSDWTAVLWPHGKRITMGAFGGTADASMSESEVGNIADLDPNGFVNWSDLKNGLVNGRDFAMFADEWAWSE
jgi:predicted outer membrane repeat protein